MRLRTALPVLALLALGLLTQPLRKRTMSHYLATQTYEDIYYLPPPRWLPVMSLGYQRALADLIWMRALVYFGDEFRHRGLVRHVFNYGDAMLELDPDFKRIYGWLGMASIYTPHKASEEFLARSVEVLRRGAERFPDDGQLAWDAGATIMYELLPALPNDDPRRENLKLQANEYMITAVRLGAAPDWLVLNNADLLAELGKADRELQHLQEMYPLIKDPKVKEQIELRIANLQSESHAEAFSQANAEFERKWQQELPYIPPSLYFFVADPPEERESEAFAL
jgi:hypothetical protein